MAASAARSPLSHAGGVPPGSSSLLLACLCWRQLWLHHLVHDPRPTGHLWCSLLLAALLLLLHQSVQLVQMAPVSSCLAPVRLVRLQIWFCTICSVTLVPSSSWSLLGWLSDTSIGCRWHKKVSSCSHHLVNTAQHS